MLDCGALGGAGGVVGASGRRVWRRVWGEIWAAAAGAARRRAAGAAPRRRRRALDPGAPSEGCSNPQSWIARRSSGLRRKSLKPEEWIPT